MSQMWIVPVNKDDWTEIGANISGTGSPFSFQCNIDYEFLAVETPVAAGAQRVPAENSNGFWYVANSTISVDTNTYEASVTRGSTTANEDVREKFYVRVAHNSRYRGVCRVWSPMRTATPDDGSRIQDMPEP